MMTASDPAELRKQVGNESTSAEVALANLYLDGSVEPQNCAQAQVFLLAAAKKGNKGAESLLATYGKRCQ
jgi:TPR repeat protein